MITIDPELQALIPQLSTEEFEQLEQNLITDGCRDPLVLWNNTIVDGHNRHEICTKYGLAFNTVAIEFEGKPQARIWMRANQIGRRNLSIAWRVDLALEDKVDLAEIGAAKRKDTEGRPSNTVVNIDNSYLPKHDTRAEIAKVAGVSTGTIAMAELVKRIDPALWKKAKAQEVTISAAYKIVTKQQKAQERKSYISEQMKTVVPIGDRYSLHNESFETLKNSDIKFDWIITDPPYLQEFLSLYEKLGEVSAHILKPGGSLLCMIGQSYLPAILAMLEKNLTYHWTLAYLTPGGKAVQIFPRRINTFWKPIFWFTNGEYAGNWIGDVTKSNPNDNDKTHHQWGQSESGMRDLMGRFVKPNDTVLDPFMGAGTTGICALKLGATFTGYEIDQTAFESSVVRISDYAKPPKPP
jgi:site-specific DNA-methyltransferase (adenine-specific)